MKIDPEIISLMSLMDDPDLTVREAVKNRILTRGEIAIEQLETLAGKENFGERRVFYMEYIEDLKEEIINERIVIYLKSPDPMLVDGLFLISKTVESTLDEYNFYSTVEMLADEISIELSEEKTAIENVKIFNYLFFNRIGFKHCDTLIQKEENALIHTVINSRSGNSVTISLIYFLLSRSVGLPIYPLCFPGGFVPVYMDNNKILFYLNIFKRGSIFLEDSLKQFFDDIGLLYTTESLKIEQDKALVSIYAELLNYLYKSQGKNRLSEKMERILSVFGESRYL
ncbi:MAG: transglutaminase family protein [Bacteroidales bacterium]